MSLPMVMPANCRKLTEGLEVEFPSRLGLT